jgi:fructuronate reductase
VGGEVRLHPTTLVGVPPSVRRPAFQRKALQPGIVHLGLGAFARAHLAAINDDAIDAGAGDDWGITGFSLRSPDVRDALAPQRGLYSLTLRDGVSSTTRVIGSVLDVNVVPEDPGALLDAIAAPTTRIVTLTVTEKGYCHEPATRKLRLDHADIAHDLAHPDSPRSAIGLLVHGLARRRADTALPLTLLSLDNLPANGDTLHGLVIAFAERMSAHGRSEALAPGARSAQGRYGTTGLARWIERECSFPNSMVDRIVPRTTAADLAAARDALGGFDDAGAVVAEPFLSLAVEDRFAAGRPDWRAGGAQFVAHAEPFERMKLRLLNGAHSTIAYLGVQAGWATVDAAMARPALARFVEALLRDEVVPTLALRGTDLGAYVAQLLRRFVNPALGHRTLQIAMDGSQKLPQRWLNTVRDRLAAGAPIDRLALALAAWVMHLRGHDEAGRAYALDDPLADELAALHARAMSRATPHERAAEITRFAPVFGDLADEPRLIAALTHALEALQSQGVAATLVRWDR